MQIRASAKWAFARCSHTEKLDLYSGTAKRLYHLD
jgi:hypothetical protein